MRAQRPTHLHRIQSKNNQKRMATNVNRIDLLLQDQIYPGINGYLQHVPQETILREWQ